jgi:2-hydroxy-3-keto-5-methylthiopentenyl-1-phosphate phosphatase
MFAVIRTDESKLLGIIARMEIEPRLGELIGKLERAGWDVVVASAGCDWYIRKLLAQSGVALTVHANPGEFSAERGLEMRVPEGSPFVSPELGVNKVAVVRDALKRSTRVAFAGDGRPDLAPALLVPPQRRFAKSWLAKKLHEIGEGFRPFDRWAEVADALILEGNQ